MHATILIDNIPANNLTPEWGLSILIQYNGKTILLDTGASSNFSCNAERLKLDLSAVDYAVLSHAHYDHADGMEEFFQKNTKAKFYLRDGCGENCYGKKWIFSKYIGIKKGILEKYRDRIVYAKGDYEICEGVRLIPHKGGDFTEIARKANLYVRRNGRLRPDDFSHEQSLVFETDKGMVVFNSCSHGGADNIIREVQETYPGKKISAMIGGFHLFKMADDEVSAFAERVRQTGIEKIYTGHCTGERAYQILHEELGDCVKQLKTGLEINF